jgi:hypothetical protein
MWNRVVEGVGVARSQYVYEVRMEGGSAFFTVKYEAVRFAEKHGGSGVWKHRDGVCGHGDQVWPLPEGPRGERGE